MALTHLAPLRGGRLLPAAVLLCLSASPAVSAQSATRTVTVHDERGVYSVVARFMVEQDPAKVMAVLSDYEQIPRFMPGVRTSSVLDRGAGRAIVEQEAVSSVMLVSKRVHLVLEIEEQPDALVFHDRCGRSFAQYDGAWRVASGQSQTVITYELKAQPTFDVPGFMLKRLLRRDSTEMIDRLQREIASRFPSHPELPPDRR
jgi:carbon monoxide dehydrogenase subunit G